MRYQDRGAFERIRERIAGAENGWFFAQIADRVAERRQELGLSQQQLAVLTGTTQSAIARLEGGGRPPRIDTLLKIAEALDCDLVVDLQARSDQVSAAGRARSRGPRDRRDPRP